MADVSLRLREQWDRLSDSSVSSRYLSSRPTEVRTPLGPVRVAIDSARIRHLLIPAGRRGDVVEDRRSRGVVVVAQKLDINEQDHWFADLVCVDSGLEDIFVRLASDVCSALDTEAAPASTIPARVLDQWRELLAAPRRSLGPQGLVGLFGELVVLRKAVVAGGPSAIGSWLGPSSHQHDFAAPGVAVEVKATTAREGRRIEVHGLEQLWAAPDTFLALAFVRLLADPDGQTIRDLSDDLISHGVPRRELLSKLHAVGYDGRRSEGDASERYICREVLLYEVDAGFPALTRASFRDGIPEGIESVNYRLDLAAAGQPIAEDDSDELLSQLASSAVK